MTAATDAAGTGLPSTTAARAGRIALKVLVAATGLAIGCIAGVVIGFATGLIWIEC